MREIRLHDTLSGKLRALVARDPGRVGIYCCGPTVYGPIHVGNARPYVVFQVLKRFLEHEGLDVTLVINITDINDKIYSAAVEGQAHSADLAREMAEMYIHDTDRLGFRRPDREPRASESIESVIGLITDLIQAGSAYQADGDVYFSVREFPEYGKLSNRRLDEMSSEEESPLKSDPLDFALWKSHKDDEDTAWSSPWGSGRPGWHIECSAMAERFLGRGFDIHGGGVDLVFPHHENEIAQSEAGGRGRFARIWMHNGMVRFDEEKMSKSVGNVRQLSVALDDWGRETILMWLLSSHYRSPVEFSEGTLRQASSRVERIRNLWRAVRERHDRGEAEWSLAHAASFFDALADDLSTPEALACLFGLVSEAHRRLEAGEGVAGAGAALREMLRVLGLESVLIADEEVDAHTEHLARERDRARARRDFASADRLRDEILARGWDVRDTPGGAQLVRSAALPDA